MRVAALAGRPARSDWQQVVSHAAAAGADLLVMPEAPNGELPELSDGPTARLMAGLCQKASVAVAFGYVERCITGTYSAALLIDRRGVCIANYRRAHVRSEDLGRC